MMIGRLVLYKKCIFQLLTEESEYAIGMILSCLFLAIKLVSQHKAEQTKLAYSKVILIFGNNRSLFNTKN